MTDGGLNRRDLLKVGGAAALTALAGCTTEDASASTETPTKTPPENNTETPTETETQTAEPFGLDQAYEILDGRANWNSTEIRRNARTDEDRSAADQMFRDLENHVNTSASTPEYLSQIRGIVHKYSSNNKGIIDSSLFADNYKAAHQHLNARTTTDQELEELAKSHHEVEGSTDLDSSNMLMTPFPVESDGPIEAVLAAPLNTQEPLYIIGPYNDKNFTQVETYPQSGHARDDEWVHRPAVDKGSITTYLDGAGACGENRDRLGNGRVDDFYNQFGAMMILGNGRNSHRLAYPENGEKIENIYENGSGLDVARLLSQSTIEHERETEHSPFSVFTYQDDQVGYREPDLGIKEFFLQQHCDN